MAVQEASDVEKSERYHDLSPKRQEIVDAWAELYEEQGKEPKNVDVVEKADSDPSYVSEVLSEYKDIARARVEQKENERSEGEVKTEGDPFNGQIPKEQNFQSIQERPNKGTTQEETVQEENESEGEGYTYEFSKEEVETIVVDEELPESLHSELKRELIHRVFGD